MTSQDFGTVGVYPLQNSGYKSAGALVLQTRLKSGTGVTWALRKRLTGSNVTDANAPRTAFTERLTNTVVTNVTAVTATAAPQLHSVVADCCDVLLEILSVTGVGILTVDWDASAGGV